MCFQYYMSLSSYASVFWSCTSTHVGIRYKYLWTVTGCVSGVCNFAKVILKQKISDNFFYVYRSMEQNTSTVMTRLHFVCSITSWLNRVPLLVLSSGFIYLSIIQHS